jgi:hypothetical protein
MRIEGCFPGPLREGRDPPSAVIRKTVHRNWNGGGSRPALIAPSERRTSGRGEQVKPQSPCKQISRY